MLCRRVARLQARGKTMTVKQKAGNEGHDKTQHTGTGQRETQTIWTHEGPWGTGGNTLGIRENNQTLDTGGRARYLKQEGKEPPPSRMATRHPYRVGGRGSEGPKAGSIWRAARLPVTRPPGPEAHRHYWQYKSSVAFPTTEGISCIRLVSISRLL